MRISYWSSDVCSSDLRRCSSSAVVEAAVVQVGGGELISFHPVVLGVLPLGLVAALRHQVHAADQEIGRASCRERVCQYVWISAVAVSLTTQNRSTQYQVT